jgi:hypothetical protein
MEPYVHAFTRKVLVTAAEAASFAALLCLVPLFMLKVAGFLSRLLVGRSAIAFLLYDALDLVLIAALSNMAQLTIVYCRLQTAGGAMQRERRSFELVSVRRRYLEAIAAIAAAELVRFLIAAQPGTIR